MRCSECGKTVATEVIDSRMWKDGSKIRRRRKCAVCGYRWSTIEMPMDAIDDFERLSESKAAFWKLYEQLGEMLKAV